MLTALILGALTGLILGLTGAGGGILAVPALVIGLGFAMTTAAPIALIAVGVAALVGAADGFHKRQVRYKAALFMALLGALSSTLGIRLAHLFPEALLATLFAAIMVFIAIRTFLRLRTAKREKEGHTNKPCILNPATGKLQWTPRCTVTLAMIGSVTGLFTGMLGVGGGFIIVPALQRFTDIRIHSIIATSLMLIAIVSLSAAGGAVLHGAVIPVSGWIFIGATTAGMIMGRLISHRIPASILHGTFGLLTLTVAVVLLISTWGPAL